MPSRIVDLVEVRAARAADGRELGHDRQVALERRERRRACARRAADVTTRGRSRSAGVPSVHSSANEPMPLRMKSRRVHASAADGGRNGLSEPAMTTS